LKIALSACKSGMKWNQRENKTRDSIKLRKRTSGLRRLQKKNKSDNLRRQIVWNRLPGEKQKNKKNKNVNE